VVPRLSFLRTSDPSSKLEDRNYHFIHLTFQEYFAARYFVRQWKAGKDLEYLDFKSGKSEPPKISPNTFLQQYKYTPRYDIVWRFTVGLLEPDKWRSDLEAKLSQWLLFECDLTGSSLLASESECPDQALRTALEKGSGQKRVMILEALQHPGRHLSDTAVAALIDLLKDKDEDRLVRSAAAEALGGQPNLSGTAVAALIDLLEDKHWHVRSAAAEALGGQPNLSGTAVAALIDLLEVEDKHGHVRSAAARALGGQPNLSDKIIEAIGLFLKSERPPNTPSSALRNPQFLESLYGSLLWRSFREQFSLYIDDSHSSCIINQANGLRTASFDSSQDIPAAVSKGRQLWNIHGYKLWGKEDAQSPPR
ncbi:armadillo-type protein, partial [Diaporthe sp. PMI_573]